jgi:hypothetical protein
MQLQDEEGMPARAVGKGEHSHASAREGVATHGWTSKLQARTVATDRFPVGLPTLFAPAVVRVSIGVSMNINDVRRRGVQKNVRQSMPDRWGGSRC